MPVALPEWGVELLDASIVGVTGDPTQVASLPDRLGEQAHAAASSFYQPEAARVERSVRGALESAAKAIAVGPGLSMASAEFQAEVRLACIRAAREGRLVLLASHDLSLLERTCDEVVVLGSDGVVDRGDPRATLEALRLRIAGRLRDRSGGVEVQGFERRGDGRARLASLELLGENGAPAAVLHSGEQAEVRIRVDFEQDVEHPVVGVLIRNRIGVTVYGTNTELEKLDFGPCAAGEAVELSFRFRCDLCPNEYTLTAASHDPDGSAHDWLEEALLFSVTDDRHTAGVANLRAKVSVTRAAAPPPSD